ncbi:hypothetical protein BC360_05720 [Ensifer sp. LC163]|nr:hypothetical protein BC363_18280 [Ensifer sp. LC384]OCP36840.1 hypothetical protein BC360_05720 [Ensifer sp. LC163]
MSMVGTPELMNGAAARLFHWGGQDEKPRGKKSVSGSAVARNAAAVRSGLGKSYDRLPLST